MFILIMVNGFHHLAAGSVRGVHGTVRGLSRHRALQAQAGEDGARGGGGGEEECSQHQVREMRS